MSVLQSRQRGRRFSDGADGIVQRDGDNRIDAAIDGAICSRITFAGGSVADDSRIGPAVPPLAFERITCAGPRCGTVVVGEDPGGGMSIDGHDVRALPPERRPSRRRAARLAAAVTAAALAVTLAVWTLVGTHVDGPLSWQLLAHSDGCTQDPLAAPGDVTWAFGIEPELPFRIQDVRLIGAHNVALVGAYVAVLNRGPDGRYALPPLGAGWPSLGDAISPDQLLDAAGAIVSGSSPKALVLRLQVDDPTVEARFQDVGIDYRAGLVRHQKRLNASQRLIPDGLCGSSGAHHVLGGVDHVMTRRLQTRQVAYRPPDR